MEDRDSILHPPSSILGLCLSLLLLTLLPLVLALLLLPLLLLPLLLLMLLPLRLLLLAHQLLLLLLLELLLAVLALLRCLLLAVQLLLLLLSLVTLELLLLPLGSLLFLHQLVLLLAVELLLPLLRGFLLPALLLLLLLLNLLLLALLRRAGPLYGCLLRAGRRLGIQTALLPFLPLLPPELSRCFRQASFVFISWFGDRRHGAGLCVGSFNARLLYAGSGALRCRRRRARATPARRQFCGRIGVRLA